MAITLRELRTAVQNYLDTKVTVTISALTPAAGVSVQPNESFTFSVTATNTPGADAIRLVNVRSVHDKKSTIAMSLFKINKL